MLVAWAVLLAVDLWQAAVRAPGALGPSGVVWLAGLYFVATAAAWLVVRVALRRSAETALVVVIGAGLACDLIETALRALPPASPWRLVAGIAGVALGFAVARAVRAVVPPRPTTPAGVALAIVLVAGAVGATWSGGARPTSPVPVSSPRVGDGAAPPNVLVVVIDTLRADHLGCYGHARPTSPVLDRLAAEGLLFERAFAQSSWTKPSTASLFTGRLPSQHQTLSETSRLPDAEVTMPERLRALGYRTAVLSANPWVTREYGFDQGVDDFSSVSDERFARVPLFMQVLKRVSQATDGRMRAFNRVKYLVLGELSTTARDTRLVNEAVDWLAAHGRERFFLYLHMMSPHHPYDPPAPFDRFVPDRARAPVKNYPRKSYHFFERGDPLPAAELADLVARYDGDVLYADTEVGRLLAELDRRGLGASTAVLVTADHGEEFYEHANWGHGQSVYDELLHVPLIVRFPGGPAGVRVATPVSHVDVVPTLLAVAGAPPAPELAGRNLLTDAVPDSSVLSELLYRYGEARALVDGTQKLVALRDGDTRRTAVYDLSTDPHEEHPLADGPDAARLMGELERRVADAMRDRSTGAEAAVDDETRRRLRALGYAR